MFMFKEKQKELRENLKIISSDKIYQMLVEKVTKCFKKNVWTMIVAITIGFTFGFVVAYYFYKHCPIYINAPLNLKILFDCIVVFTLVLFNSFLQWIGFMISSRRLSSDELSYLNGVLLKNAVRKKSDNGSIRINTNGIFCLTPDGKLLKVSEDITNGVEVIIKEYYQLTDLCLVTAVREYQVYENNKLINKIIKKVKSSSWEFLMDEL